MAGPGNYFDRFDIPDDADLTQPQGGMNRPRSRAELTAAAAPAPGAPNFFDRFDGAPASPAPSAPKAEEPGWASWALGLADRAGIALGVVDPATYRGRNPDGSLVTAEQAAAAPTTISATPQRGLGERFVDSAEAMVEHYSPAALAARQIASAVPTRDTWQAAPGADNSQAAQIARAPGVVAAAEREWRDQEALRAAADPAWRDGDSWYSPGTLLRFGADFAGGAVGGIISDPTTMIAPGATLLTKMLGQAAVGGVADAAVQAGEIGQDVRDRWNPLQTGISAAGGAAIVGGLGAIPKVRQWWAQRGVNVDNVRDEDLVAASLDGTISGANAAAELRATLEGVGARPEQFSTPEAAATAAGRAAAAQGRAPANFEGLPEAGRSRQSQEAFARALADLQTARQAGHLPARTVPDDVTIIAAPEGNIRSDDAGGIAGLDRKRSADSAVLDAARQRVADDPLVAAVLDSDLSPQMKVAALADRIERTNAADAPIDTSVPGIAEGYRAPTPAAAAPTVARAANPSQSRIHDITIATESGGRRYGRDGQLLRSNKGAQGEMQVMPGTSRDPGYGVRAARDNSPDELARVGRDYIDALQRHYDGDMQRAWAAYNAGPGAVDGAIAKHGRDWLQHMPAETRAYVGKNMAALGGRAPDPVYRAADFSTAEAGRDGTYSFDAADAGAPLRENSTANMGAAEKPQTFKERQADDASSGEMATGTSTRPFRTGPDDAEWEARARATADELHAKAQEDLNRRWEQAEQRRQERQAQRGADERFERERTRTEEASEGDPAAFYRGKYDQRPVKAGDFWATTPEGYVAGKTGAPVGFRNAREAAKWAAGEKLGGDFEFVSYGPQNRAGTQRVSLRRREGSTYGDRVRPAPAEPAAGRSDDTSQRMLEAPRQPAAAAPPARDATIDPAPVRQAPPEPVRPPIPPAGRDPIVGRSEQVATARGRAVDTRFEVHELRDLVSSDRPEFDQRFQPRDRSARSSSDAQVAAIASRLDPQRLGSSREASGGAPILGPDRMVESGNGRVAAIRRAYEMHPERAAEYRAMVERDHPDAAGFDQPVLVRRRTTDMDDTARAAFTREANERDTMGMSSTEQAKVDSRALTGDQLDQYRGGAVTDAGNRDFVRSWIDRVASPAERNQLMQPDGSLSADGVRRIRSSLLAKAFDDADLVAKVVEAPDTEIRAIGNTLTDAAPGFAKLRERVEAGELPREYDITTQVAQAANTIAQARAAGTRIGDAFRQDDMFGGRVDPVTEAVARLMFKDEAMTRPRSAADMADGLRFYLDEAAKHSDTDMFGGGASAARAADILEAARQRLDRTGASNGATLFSRAVSAFGEERQNVGALADELRGFAADHQNPAVRGLARHLADLVGDAQVRYGDDLGDGIRGAAMIDERGQASAQVRRHGDTETVLHEAVHVATLSRYGELVDGAADGTAIAIQVRALDQLRDRAAKAFARRSDDPSGQIAHALSSTDEFLAGGLTSPRVQAFLKRHNAAGLWGRFVDGVRNVLGLSPRYGSLLDRVLDQGAALIQRMEGDAPRSTRDTTLFSRDAGDAGPNPKGWDRVVDMEGLRGDVAGIRAAVGDPRGAVKRFTEPMMRVVSAGVFTNDARLRGLASRFNSPAIRELADHFNAEAGKGSGTGRTYHEAVQRASITRTQQVFDALEPHLANKASMERIRDMLATPNKTIRASDGERAAARAVRDVLKETLSYRREAGETIGEVTDGYYPRLLDVAKVAGQREKFLDAATRLYRGTGMTAGDAEKAAQRWFEHAFDTYAGLDGGFGFTRASADGVGSSTAKAREFGKQADELLRDFYQGDVMNTMAAYFGGAARKAEHARRFGVKGADGSGERLAWEKEHGKGTTQLEALERRIKDDVRGSGLDPQGVLQQIDSVMKSNLGQMGTRDQFARTAVSYLHTWNQLAKMDRVTISSLGDLTMGFIRGGPRYGFSFLKDHLTETVRQIRKAPPSDAARWAEAFGVANDAFVNQVLTARAGIEGGTAGTQKTLTNFYKAVGLHQFTEGGRIAAAKMAQRMVHDFAHDLQSTSPRIRSRADLYLRELGVKDTAAFGEAIRAGTPSRADVLADKGLAAEYGTAVYRAVQQTILMPSRAEKPTWSAHPVGSLLFSLMSYSYGFKKNVLDRTGRLAMKGVQDRDPALLVPAFSLSIMAAFMGLNDTFLRPALFGSSYDFDKESPTEAMMRIADRSGFLGAASPFVNAVKAVRYDRSLAESLSGPVVGSIANAVDKGVLQPAFGRNSPNTNTAERNAAAAFYDAVVDPAVDGIAAARLKGIARSAAILGTGNKRGGLAPGDKSAFVDAVGGEKEGE